MTDIIVLSKAIKKIPGLMTLESLTFAKNFFVKDDDIFLVTYPRSGTHWMIEIVCLILSEGDPTWVQTVQSHTRFPFIEYENSQKILMDKDRPHLIASHLPIQLFPNSYFSSRAKIIYIIRNPRDVATSIYHIQNQAPKIKSRWTFEESLHAFTNGDLTYGSWFDHTLGWLTRRTTENFLLMSYEELQWDLRASIQKVCRFLGKHLSPEQLESVVRYASFSVMKDNKMSNTMMLKISEDKPDFLFDLLRKGLCGDWKNHFTVAQCEAFDKVYQEKMSSIDPILFPWLEDC